jgi:hypothetical protein
MGREAAWRQSVSLPAGRGWHPRATNRAEVTGLGLTKLALRRLRLAELSLAELLAMLVAAQSVLARAVLAERDLACAVDPRVTGLYRWAAVVGTALVKPAALLMTGLAQRIAALLAGKSSLVVPRLDAGQRLAAVYFQLLVLRRLLACTEWLPAKILVHARCLLCLRHVTRRRPDRRLR